MDDIRDDVIIARPFETDAHIFGVCISISMPHLSSLLAFLSLLHWSYMWHIDIDVLGFVWGFRQSSFTIRSMFPITRRNVVFVCATS